MITNKELPILKRRKGLPLSIDLSEKNYSSINYLIRNDIYYAFMKWAEEHDKNLKTRKDT